MKHSIKIVIFIILASFGMNFYAAEQKAAAAQTTHLLKQKQKTAVHQYTEEEKKRFARDIEKIKSPLKRSSAQQTLLTYAIDNGYTNLIPYLIDTNPHLITKPNSDGHSPLHLAVIKNDVPMIKLLLTHGAAINAKDKQGNTPIFAASTDELVKLLLDYGADLSIKATNGESLIHRILSNGSWIGADLTTTEKMLNLILESPQLQSNPALKDTLINEPNPQGLKPLCQTAKLKWADGAKLLIKHGADCADEKYKEFLVPLIKEVEKERAKTTFRVLKGQTPQEQRLIRPLANTVRQYVEGEQTPAAQEEEEPAEEPSANPTTGVEEVD